MVVSRTGSSTVVALGPNEASQGLLTLQGAHADVAARDVCVNLAGAAVLIGIYLDAGSSPENAGCLTAYDPDRPFSAQNARLADVVQTDVLAQLNSRVGLFERRSSVRQWSFPSGVNSEKKSRVRPASFDRFGPAAGTRAARRHRSP